jgi:hypothetical protein
VVGVRQELFLVRDDLRERVRVQYALLGLVRKTGSGLGKQRDHVVEAGRTSGRQGRRRVNDHRPTSTVWGKRPLRIREVAREAVRFWHKADVPTC